MVRRCPREVEGVLFLSWVVFSRLRCLTVILFFLEKTLFGCGVRKVWVVLLESIGSTFGILNARTKIDNMLSLLWALSVTVRIPYVEYLVY